MVEEGLMPVTFSVSPRKQHLLFSTKNPSTVQRMPWPRDEEGLDAENPAHLGYDTWLLNEDDFGWLVEQDGRFLLSFI